MDGKRTDSNGASGAWAWIRRNEVILIGGLIIAAIQYQGAQTATHLEQLGARITAVQENQDRLADRLMRQIAAVQENQDRLADRLMRQIAAVQENQDRLAGQLGARITASNADRRRALRPRATTRP